MLNHQFFIFYFIFRGWETFLTDTPTPHPPPSHAHPILHLTFLYHSHFCTIVLLIFVHLFRNEPCNHYDNYHYHYHNYTNIPANIYKTDDYCYYDDKEDDDTCDSDCRRVAAGASESLGTVQTSRRHTVIYNDVNNVNNVNSINDVTF